MKRKGADQLLGYHATDLGLCFRTCKKQVFSCASFEEKPLLFTDQFEKKKIKLKCYLFYVCFELLRNKFFQIVIVVVVLKIKFKLDL